VGIRKTVGSARIQIIKQFFGESLLVVVIAFIVAILIVLLLLPWFNDVTSKKISFPFTESLFWILSLLLFLLPVY
jgi:ABC-type antimicrobial peptide transport system permease subunit